MESEEKAGGEKDKDKANAKGPRKRKQPKPPLQSDHPMDEGMPATSKPDLPPATGTRKELAPQEPAKLEPTGASDSAAGGIAEGAEKGSRKKPSGKTGPGKAGSGKPGAGKPRLVSEIMTEDPVCCTAETPLVRVARLMAENSCGAIPVIRSQEDRVPVGIITDRDVVVRTVALGKNPLDMTAGDVLTESPVTVHPDNPVEDCVAAMRGYKLRRIIVVDHGGRVCGLVALAQIARFLPKEESGETVRDISQPPI